MITLKYNPQDLRYVFVFSDKQSELSALEKHLNKIPNYMFLPSFRGIPKAEVFLHRTKTGSGWVHWIHAGLWMEVVMWCDKNGISHQGVADNKQFKYREEIDKDEFRAWVKGLELNIEPRDYQIDASHKILTFRKSLSQLATRSGKTLMAYLVFRWMLERGGGHKILMIVPSIQLVKQGVADMGEYKEFFKSEEIWAESKLCTSSNLTIGTFQSLIKRLDPKSPHYNPRFFDGYDVVCCDEAHTAKCKSIETLLSQPFMKNVKLLFGFSGSLPPENTIESFECQSLVGPVIQDIRSRELMDDGFISNIDITQIRINHPLTPELRSEYIRCGEYLCSNNVLGNEKLPKEQQSFTMVYKKTLPYALRKVREEEGEGPAYMEYLIDLCKAKGSNLLMLEQMLLHRDTHRLDIINDLIRDEKGNGIVFAHHVEYLRHLYNIIKAAHPDKEVYLIHGATTPKKREAIKARMLETDNVVLVASYSCVGTGLTFKNLNWGVFAQSFKSNIINKQSLGRGLCLSEGKDSFRVYDLIDTYPTGRILSQGKAKIHLYEDEEFEYRIINK